MADKKEIKYSPPGKKPALIRPGDKFMLEPNDFFRIHGVGLLYNRTGHAVIMELLPEDIRHGS